MKIELPPDVEASCRELVGFWGWDNTDANTADCAIGFLKDGLWKAREEIRETGRQPSPPRQHQVIPDARALENSTLADLGVDPSRLAPIERETTRHIHWPECLPTDVPDAAVEGTQIITPVGTVLTWLGGRWRMLQEGK